MPGRPTDTTSSITGGRPDRVQRPPAFAVRRCVQAPGTMRLDTVGSSPWSRRPGSTRPVAPAPSKPAGLVGAKSPGCDTGPLTSAPTAGGLAARFKSLTGAAAAPSTCRCPRATAGGPSCRSGSPTSRRTRCGAGSRPCRTRRVTRDSSIDGPTAAVI